MLTSRSLDRIRTQAMVYEAREEGQVSSHKGKEVEQSAKDICVLQINKTYALDRKRSEY